MSNLDTFDFINRNGRKFFASSGTDESSHDLKCAETVDIAVELTISKTHLREIYRRCRRDDVTIQEYLVSVIEGQLDD
jgi:hypothetical protein